MFSIDARRTLLSVSNLFPSKPTIACTNYKIIFRRKNKSLISKSVFMATPPADGAHLTNAHNINIQLKTSNFPCLNCT